MKRLLILTVFLSALKMFAQEADTQILVFRNTGEVNLFYSNELDSIVNSYVDSSGKTYEEPVAQLFYSKDTTLVVPIAEIDSVAIGERNTIEFKPNVLEISDETYIIKYENGVIHFKTNTPSDVLPAQGQKVYYTERTIVFPHGLCAEVTKVEKRSDAILVHVKDVELKELFTRFFYAEKIEEAAQAKQRGNNTARKLASFSTDHSFTSGLNLGNFGSINPDIKLAISGDIVANPFRDYYHAKVALKLDMGVTVEAKCSDSGSIIDYEGPTYSAPVYSLLKLINVDLGAALFCNFDAELAIKYALKGKMIISEFEWTRRDGNSIFNANRNNAEDLAGEAKIDMTLNGSLFFGLKTDIDFNIIGKAAGARATLKSGPKFEGELSMGVLTKLSEQTNTDLYAKGTLSVCLNNDLDFGWYTTNLFLGEENYHSLAKANLTLLKREINLFPEFTHTLGTALPAEENVVSVATIAQVPSPKDANVPQNETLARPLEVKLAIVDQDEKVIKEEKVDSIGTGRTSAEGLSTEIELSNDLKDLRVQPIFKYMNMDIKAQTGNILQDGFIQPFTSYMSNGLSTIISGSPFIGEASNDSTVFIVGSYLPVVLTPNSAFNVPPITKRFGSYIDLDESANLIGTWMDDNECSLTFEEDMTGTCADSLGTRTFEYELNSPSAGNLRLIFKDESVEVYTIRSITKTELNLYHIKKGYVHYTKAE